MRTFTHGGDRYLLGQSEYGYGIWQIGQEYGDPVLGFPGSPEGWSSAVEEFRRVEPDARPIVAQLPYLPVPSPGYAGVPPSPGTMPMTAPSNGVATAAGTIGIVGAVLSLIPLIGIAIGLIMGVLAIIFGGVGTSRAGATGHGKGLAITGLVLGILTVIFKLIPGVDVL